MNLQYQGPPRYVRQRGGGRLGVGRDGWRPSILPPLAWGGDFGRERLPPISWGGGGCRREDLIQDSFHALNRTWNDDESFYTLSSGESYRSLLSLTDDEDDGASDPGGDSLLGFLGQTEVFIDSLEPVESPPRVPRGRASFPPGTRGQVTAGRLSRGRGSSQPSSRRSAWWDSPQVSIYPSIYPSPRASAWWTPRPGGQPVGLYQRNLTTPPAPVFRRGVPVRGTREHDVGGGRIGRVSGERALLALEDTDRILLPHRAVSRPPARRPGCELGPNRRRPCHPPHLADVYYLPRPVPLHEEEQPPVFPEDYLPRRPRFPSYRW